MHENVEEALRAATEHILCSEHRKKLVVAGPGAGKTYLFRKLLERARGARDQRLVLTFINNLRDDLEGSLGDLAQTYTLHGYCQSLHYQHADLRTGLSEHFRCYPKLARLIQQDWLWLNRTAPPKFVGEMRDLECKDEHETFYLERASFYDAVDFDDSVYRVCRELETHGHLTPKFELVLVDEFQDFNKMEAEIIALLARENAIAIAGDDDQALYSKFRGASWEYIRNHHRGDQYENHELPFCMRCTEVIVDAFGDVVRIARAAGNLDGRIDKSYRFYAPLKRADSDRYPRVDWIETSVQSGKANYFGRYIEEAVRAIPQEDIDEANERGEPVALIIGSKPYRPQVEQHLVEAGLMTVEEKVEKSKRDAALEFLKEDPTSNLGWRLILASGDKAVAKARVREAAEKGVKLVDTFPEEERATVLEEANSETDEGDDGDEEDSAAANGLNVKSVSYEGSKGLSAQHVFLIGLHEGEMPRKPKAIEDIEVCRFLVGITRTKKKCSVLTTRLFAGRHKKEASSFLAWIDGKRIEKTFINAAYWKARKD